MVWYTVPVHDCTIFTHFHRYSSTVLPIPPVTPGPRQKMRVNLSCIARAFSKNQHAFSKSARAFFENAHLNAHAIMNNARAIKKINLLKTHVSIWGYCAQI